MLLLREEESTTAEPDGPSPFGVGASTADADEAGWWYSGLLRHTMKLLLLLLLPLR